MATTANSALEVKLNTNSVTNTRFGPVTNRDFWKITIMKLVIGEEVFFAWRLHNLYVSEGILTEQVKGSFEKYRRLGWPCFFEKTSINAITKWRLYQKHQHPPNSSFSSRNGAFLAMITIKRIPNFLEKIELTLYMIGWKKIPANGSKK